MLNYKIKLPTVMSGNTNTKSLQPSNIEPCFKQSYKAKSTYYTSGYSEMPHHHEISDTMLSFEWQGDHPSYD